MTILAVVLCGGALVWPNIASVRSPHATGDLTRARHGHARPLGHPPTAPHGVGSFSFVAEQVTSEEPVAYEPCRKILYSIHEELAPPGTDEIIEDAVRQVARATGLVFARREYVDRHWTVDTLNTNYGHNPVIIDWTTPDDVPALRGVTSGLGRSVYTTDGYTALRYYVTGAVALDAHQLQKALDLPGGAAQVRAVVMRELSHVLGLAYVEDRNELMSKMPVGRTSFGPGDREGLAALGSGRCF